MYQAMVFATYFWKHIFHVPVILTQILYTTAMLIDSLDKDDDRDETEEDSEEEMEKDRLKDLEERDKFAERLKTKDKDKQRSVMSKSEKRVNSAIDLKSHFDIEH